MEKPSKEESNDVPSENNLISEVKSEFAASEMKIMVVAPSKMSSSQALKSEIESVEQPEIEENEPAEKEPEELKVSILIRQNSVYRRPMDLKYQLKSTTVDEENRYSTKTKKRVRWPDQCEDVDNTQFEMKLHKVNTYESGLDTSKLKKVPSLKKKTCWNDFKRCCIKFWK